MYPHLISRHLLPAHLYPHHLNQSAYDLIVDLKKSLVMPEDDFVKLAPMYDTSVNDNYAQTDSDDEDIDEQEEDDGGLARQINNTNSY